MLKCRPDPQSLWFSKERQHRLTWYQKTGRETKARYLATVEDQVMTEKKDSVKSCLLYSDLFRAG